MLEIEIVLSLESPPEHTACSKDIRDVSEGLKMLKLPVELFSPAQESWLVMVGTQSTLNFYFQAVFICLFQFQVKFPFSVKT